MITWCLSKLFVVERDYAKVRLSLMKKRTPMSEKERRQYHRVSFATTAKLSSDNQFFSCQIIDLSIQGVLLRAHGMVNAVLGTKYSLTIPLSETEEDSSSSISMKVTLAHNSPEKLGFRCESIDLESITHLRRIVELNSGDSQLLERDFESLVKQTA